MAIILPANTLSAGGYEVANSCRFNDGDSPKMAITPSGGSLTTGTFSTWVKRSKLGAEQNIVSWDGSGSQQGNILFQSGDNLLVQSYNGSGWDLLLTTNAKYRDTSAWMHICVAFDTTQGTAANRCKLYVNGTQVTSFASETYPSENGELQINSKDSSVLTIGAYNDTNYLGGYLAETVWIDGTAYAASDFGEFDSDSPTIWKPKDVSGLTFGTNGFYLDFEDSANLGNDANGGTDLTETNLAATDQATDTPTLNYPTLNPIIGVLASLTISEGNLNMVASDANYRSLPATMGATAGKWYAEFKAVSGFSGVDKNVGIYRADNNFVATTGLGNFSGGTTWSYGATGNVRTNAGNNDTGEATYTNGDIIGVAMDLDNLKLYFAKNNAWINSGNPESGATGTGAYTIINAAPKEFYHFAATTISSGGAALWSCNFGSPSYANTSDAADADGYGAFEYAPPSGYFAMNSKNLAEYG